MTRNPAGIIFDVKRFATDDGPGIRTTAFFKGCPLRCLWCHSPESIARGSQVVFFEARCLRCGACRDVCPRGAHLVSEEERRLDRAECDDCGACVEACPAAALEMRGRKVRASEVVAMLTADAEFYRQSGGGITLSGGEPTLQPAFAAAVLRGGHEHGLHTALDTSGHTSWHVLQDLLPYVDLFLFDLKHADPHQHRRLTGVGNDRILDNLRRLTAAGANVQVRVPLVPGLNDSKANVWATAVLARNMGVRSMALLPYNRAAGSKYRWLGQPYPLEHLETQPRDYLEMLADLVRAAGIAAELGR